MLSLVLVNSVLFNVVCVRILSNCTLLIFSGFAYLCTCTSECTLALLYMYVSAQLKRFSSLYICVLIVIVAVCFVSNAFKVKICVLLVQIFEASMFLDCMKSEQVII